MSKTTTARAALLAGLLLAAACGEPRPLVAGPPTGACVGCHGGTNDQTGAPPLDAHGKSDPKLTSVGAHARHMAVGVACSSCHVVPARTDSPGHIDGQVTLTFGGMAVASGSTPSWDRASATCSNVYCHGSRFTGPSVGADPAPVWTGTLSGGACGACHSAQPRGHPAFAPADCTQCHPGTVDATGQLIAGGQHLDGRLQVTVSSCTGCHGGVDNASGAPPRDVAGHTATTEVTVGAHTAHVAAGLACTTCHPVPDLADVGAHMGGGTAQITWGGVATAGGATPTWDRTQATCSGVYCHGAFPGGNQRTATWTSVGTGQGACGACHGQAGAEFPGAPVTNHPKLATGSGATVCNACHPGAVDAAGRPVAGGQHLDGTLQVDPYSKHPAGFIGTPHQAAAAAGVATCMRCHAAKPPAQVTTLVCSSCHDALAGGKDWTTTCNTCHGSAVSDAPPPWNTPLHDPTAGGAHQAHVLAASQLSAPLGCEYCHQKPATVLSEGHLDGAIHVTGYTGVDPTWKLAEVNPGWSAATSSCATAYCHGAFPGGNALNAPVWTAVGQGQAACGTCHGLPPAAPHPELGSTALKDCNSCHPATIDPSGALILPSAGGKHLDGTVQVEGGHQPSWMDPTSPGFHAAAVATSLQSCRVCHAPNLDGGYAKVACASCHGATWRTTCTMCHGGDQDTSGAPPRTTWGQGADPIRVGAHQRHVRGGAIQPGGFDCEVCHVKPADALSPGHIDGPTATVAFSGVALPATAWDRGTPTCTTYCHGTSLTGGTLRTPSWTGSGPLDCTSCHGAPPTTQHPPVTGGAGACNACHPDTVDATGAIVPRASGGKHVDGQVQFVSGHKPSWMDSSDPGFHGGAIYASLSSCQYCHGANLDGVGGATTVGCTTCHGPAWKTDCTMCHGATDNTTGAPPRATFIHRGQPRAVGAHSAHVGRSDATTTTGAGLAQKLGCESCHAAPTDAFSAGHVDGAVAVTGYTGSNPARHVAMTDPGWNPATLTCATSYCHGATLQGGTRVTPNWTGATGTQAACGACHGLPPATGPLWTPTTPAHQVIKHLQAHCGRCHDGFTESTVNPALHVNASRDVSISHTAPYPDPPAPAAPTMEACSALVTVRTAVAGWDCAGCHGYRDYAYQRCCADTGAPNPEWCSTYW